MLATTPMSALELCDAIRSGKAFDASRLNRILGLDAMHGLHVPSSDGDVVDETEAHRCLRARVMARRPHEGKTGSLGSVDCDPCGE